MNTTKQPVIVINPRMKCIIKTDKLAMNKFMLLLRKQLMVMTYSPATSMRAEMNGSKSKLFVVLLGKSL